MKIETDASFYTDKDGHFLRSSALKTYESCSFAYFANYSLKIPQEENDGMSMGNVAHSFFECMLNLRRKPLHKQIIKANSISISPSCVRLVKKLIKKNNLTYSPELFTKIDKMLLVGLNADFYVKGGTIVGKEYRFKHINESPKYKIYGTIDKIALKGKYIIIDDFKSSKVKFSGSDIHSSVQALMYSLACKKLYPDYIPKVRFIFLQYPDSPMQEVEFNEDALKGFEYYLESIQKATDNFTEKDAYANFAYDKGRPTDNSFGGVLSCGYGKFKGHKNREGKEYWNCSFKWPKDYYVLLKDNKIIKTSQKNDLIPQNGETVEKRHWPGCPRWNNVINDLPETQIKNFDTSNVLDDF